VLISLNIVKVSNTDMENPLNTFLLASLGAFVTGALATVKMDSSKKPIESCVEAYYAQKYSSQKYPIGPRDTFKRCMKKNFPESFTEIREKYKPVSKEESS
jgi:hypothetical protein